MMLFETARDRLREIGCEAVRGIISPVNDKYSKKGLLPSKHRLEMCRRAASETSWVRCDDFEATAEEYVRTLAVLRHVKETLSAEFGEDIHPVLICGGDLLDSFTRPGVWRREDVEVIFRDFGVVCVHREGFDEDAIIKKDSILSKYPDHVLVIEPYIENNISSTLVRDLIKQHRSPRFIVPCSVCDYIEENGFYTEDK